MSTTLNSVEKYLNIAGSIPLAGIISGSLRSLAGTVQGIAGLIFAGTALVASVVDPQKTQKWQRRADIGCTHILHGAFNRVRGVLEIFAAATIIPSLCALAIQSSSQNGFNPILKYGQEFLPSATSIPLLACESENPTTTPNRTPIRHTASTDSQ